MTIDSHHHFWKYDPDEYAWIDDSMAVLKKDFLPADLREASMDRWIDVAQVAVPDTGTERTNHLDSRGLPCAGRAGDASLAPGPPVHRS